MDDENNRLQWNPNTELLLAYRLQSTDYIRSSQIRTDSGSYGTAGQVLTTQGFGNDWTWETPSTGNNVSIGVSPPSSPSHGDLWWDSDDGDLHIYYDDGSGTPSAQWVSVGGGSGGGSQGSSSTTPAIVATQRTSDFSVTSTSLQDVMSVTINPTVSGSKLLVTAGGGARGDIDTDDESNTHNQVSFCELQVYRGSTPIGEQASVGSGVVASSKTGEGFYISIVDTNNHGGNDVTYTIKAKMSQSFHGNNPSGKIRKASSLMIQEIF